ncbi:hypothetical protein BH20CHL7_BH20CHL7_17680 [soil metagenome]
MTSLLYDAMAHHVWANDRLLEVCLGVTAEQLEASVPGTYGPIIAAWHHLAMSDAWYLSFFGDVPATLPEGSRMPLPDLRAALAANGTAWLALLERGVDPDTDVPEEGDRWRFHAPAGMRLAQVVQHGNDHRSQICTILTTLGIEPPEIDLWAWAEATGRTRPEWLGEGPPPAPAPSP